MRDFNSLDEAGRAELWASLSFRHLPGVGPVKAKKLVETFGSALAAVEARAEWRHACGLPEGLAAGFNSGAWREKAKADWDNVRRVPCGLLFISDPDYPDYLKEIPDAPLALFYLGDKNLLSSPGLAIVGARKCTNEGMAVTAHVARGVAEAGISIISGMALGIDRVAHLCGLEGAGSSIAVLGCGVDVLYPHKNEDLYRLMTQKGLVISEFPPGTRPQPSYFPIRNRIISGLSYGVLVVEAALRSGTLITARLANEQNRQVFAIPGSPLARTSQGCQELIRRGARPVFSAHDIIEDLAPLLNASLQAGLNTFMERRNLENAREESEQFRQLWQLPPAPLPWTAGPQEENSLHLKETRQRKKRENAFVPEHEPPSRSLKLKRKQCKNRENPENGLKPELAASPEHSGFTPDEKSELVLRLLGSAPRHIDDLARDSGLAASVLSGILLQLEVYGLAGRKPGMFYVKT